MARREARQMLTAGGADQQVADSGPNGHSVFTWILLQGLDGRADLNGDGVITATELAAYVAPAVSALSHQTPAFGSLPGSEGGDFMFDPKHETEFLNQDSAQLGQDAIKLNAELEELRAQIREESRKNEELRKQLEAAEARLKQGAPSVALTAGATASSAASPTEAAPLAPPVDAPAALNDEGMRLYKEKRYAEAAAKFVEASKAKPASALFANNAGFAYFRMGQYQEAAKWFQQAISVDSKRAIAYLNLGDTYQEMHRMSEAKSAYEEFLALAPNSKSAPAVRDKLNALPLCGVP
jgi:tetratricopeptide (TPR) repeat protein